ncbi:class I SAM-dependent methyltransferase [Nitrosomonas sp. ANs5]|uniref:class I SAM-dependent methyltransferase n=1 Tax=Nitrosomonas sp. ANs5 TaxID=3423941 RepID=UPI003D3271FF
MGWFTRRIADLPQSPSVTSVDIDGEALTYARGQDSKTCYLPGNAVQLPFADSSFDRVMSVTALCFVTEWPQALKEIIRVTRGRFVVGVSNRHSLLWSQKGRGSNQSAYQGAHGHTRRELRDVLTSLLVKNVHFQAVIWLPDGSVVSRALEACLPHHLPLGGFLLVAGDKV